MGQMGHHNSMGHGLMGVDPSFFMLPPPHISRCYPHLDPLLLTGDLSLPSNNFVLERNGNNCHLQIDLLIKYTFFANLICNI